ncbi:MAG: hypothetical protein K0U98_15875 [Deltaproteobacteria bacterium]|nr:hypothetical protein [Deltaproteobacteria bacterium]
MSVALETLEALKVLDVSTADRVALTWLLDLALRSTLLLAMIFASFALLRRRSAALRHHVGLIGLGSLLVLPAIMAVLPAELAILPSLASWLGRSGPATSGAVSAGPTSPWLMLAGGLWVIGAVLVLLRALGARRAVVGYFLRSSKAADLEKSLKETEERLGTPQTALVCTSKEVDIPVTFGIWAPKILLPDEARSWSAERTEMVLLHELAHIRRQDLLSQTFSLLVCGIFWFHPAAWALSRRLDLEREKACDDLVLQHRGDALEYARQLVAIAEGLRGRPPAAFGVSMARPSQLRTRLKALLDHRVDRRAPKPIQAALSVLFSLGLLLPISAVPVSSDSTSTPRNPEALEWQAREASEEDGDEASRSRRGEERGSLEEGSREEMERPASGHRGQGRESGHSGHSSGPEPRSHRSGVGHASGDHERAGSSESHRSGGHRSGGHQSGSHESASGHSGGSSAGEG